MPTDLMTELRVMTFDDDKLFLNSFDLSAASFTHNNVVNIVYSVSVCVRKTLHVYINPPLQ